MRKPFEPRLEILPDAQRRLWSELGDVPMDFVLYGGTALALRLGHRQSVDFDFFGARSFDPDKLLGTIPFLAKARVTQKSPDTLSVIVDRGEPVQVSFFGVPKLGRIDVGDRVEENGITIASICDLAGTKLAVVQRRAEVKDYIDIDAMILAGVIDLPHSLAVARHIYGDQFSPELSLKALCYFEDGNVCDLAMETRERLVAAVQGVDLARLPSLERFISEQHDGSS
jgi:hypothetical protein